MDIQEKGKKGGREQVEWPVPKRLAYLVEVDRRNAFPGGSVVKNLPGSAGKEPACNAGNTGGMGSIVIGEYPLEEEMAIHSSIFAWKIPRTEEPGGVQSMGSQESDMTQ